MHRFHCNQVLKNIIVIRFQLRGSWKVNIADFVSLLFTDLISLVRNVRISARNPAWTTWFASRCRVTAKDTNARSLRFRFKTFELDWETPWVFAVSHGHLKVSWQTISRPTSCSHRRISLLAAVFEELFPNACSFYCSASRQDRFRSFTSLLAAYRTTINFHVSRNIRNASLCAR